MRKTFVRKNLFYNIFYAKQPVLLQINRKYLEVLKNQKSIPHEEIRSPKRSFSDAKRRGSALFEGVFFGKMLLALLKNRIFTRIKDNFCTFADLLPDKVFLRGIFMIMEQANIFDPNDLQAAVNALQQGGVILYPTDTVWGLGCDATNPEAVKRIFEIKKRDDRKSMLVLLDTPAKLQAYVDEVPDMAWDLIDLSEKPLTIVYPKAKNLAPNLPAEDGSIGIRITKEKFSNTLCRQFRKPIVSTSANLSGMPGARCFGEIPDEIKSAVDYVVRFRQNEKELPSPSSIIKLDAGNVIKIIRP